MLNFVFENLSPTTVTFAVIVLIIITVFRSSYNSWRSPGPWGIPFLGYYPFLHENYGNQMVEMAKKYGDAFVITLAGKQFLHLGSHKALREAFITKSEYFTGRSSELSVWEHFFSGSILMTNDENWRVWRKFLGQSMRELGIGPKEQLKEPILHSVEVTLQTLKKNSGTPIDITDLLTTQCAEVLRGLVLGYNVSTDTTVKLAQHYGAAFTIMVNKVHLLFGDFARLFILPRCKGYKELLEHIKTMQLMLGEIIDAHKKNFDPEHPRDLIDLYLREKQSRQLKNDPEVKYFTDKAFASNLIIILGDGTLSIAALTAMCLKTLASKPEVQDAIYEEIVSQIGTERLPTYEDKPKFPYTNSVIKEVQRTAPFVTAMPSLVSNHDTTISGVYVPKGTITLINFRSIHDNPKVYKNPNDFNPKRFLSDVENKNAKVDNPISFGIGKRACAGESLVMIELFMFFTAILQQFTIEEEKRSELKKDEKDITEQLDWKLIAYPRKHND